MSIVQRGLAAFAAAVAALSFCVPVAAASPPPVEHYTKWPAIEDVVISPSGKRLAVIVFGPTGYRQLGVMDLDPVGKARLVAGFDDADVHDVEWVSDERLVFSAYQRGAQIRDGGGGTFAADHDGSALRTLIAASYNPARSGSLVNNKVLPWPWRLHSVTDDGSEDIFVYRYALDNRDEVKHVELARLATRTGNLTTLSYGMPKGTRNWVLDGKGEPRIVASYVEGRTKIHWRARGDAAWTEVADFDALQGDGFWPLVVDGDRILVSRRAGESSSVHVYDPTKRQVDPDALIAIKGFDLWPRPYVDSKTRRLVGLQLSADRRLSVWFDADLQRVQKSIDAALPAGRRNALYCGRCESSRFIVVRSSSDRHPGEYLLYDRTKQSLERIGAERPWIEESTQAKVSFHRVATRDGLSMPVYVTHPAGVAADAPLPAVVLVHGGPYWRGAYVSWQAEAQFLASRGYRVIQPEFRGSEGYGFAHFRAGWKQWGRAMQDDLVDAVQWAAAQKLVDASRVCVYGDGYGGYASLMAPITHPGVFRCAASYAGLTDIDLAYAINWSGYNETFKRYGMPVLIGDREKDAPMLAMASPLKRAAEIKVPVLLGHGAADRWVPMDHAKEFVAAARKAGVAIEPIYYNGEGHRWWDPANHTDFLTRLEKFLARSLKAP